MAVSLLREWLVDTSAYSRGMSGWPAAQDVLRTASRLVLCPVTIGELLAGFRRGPRERENREMLREFLASPRVELVSIDEETAERYAFIAYELRVSGRPIPTNDLWIAATAMQHGLPLLTADQHFLAVRQIVVHLLS